MRYQALVFDMDGTLLNTLEDLALATNRALTHHGFDPHPTESYRLFVGSGARMLIERALPSEACTESTIDACLATFKAYYDVHWADHTALYSGMADLLTQVQELGLDMAILTNKPQAFAESCVKQFLSGWSWRVVQGQVEGVALKPSAEISVRVTESLGVAPEEVLYIGDSNVDVLTAQNAGYDCAGVTWGFRSEQELREAGAQIIAHHPDDILKLLN
jgi:phosphoglycolate phosphatase